MILKPRSYVSFEDRIAMLPKLGDDVSVAGETDIFEVTMIGLKWMSVKNKRTGITNRVYNKAYVHKYIPPKPEEDPENPNELTIEQLNAEFGTE